jgi:putative restriction endonuclease
MDPGELKEKISKIKIWQRNGERAPHKPLLLLYALGRISRNEPRLMCYHRQEVRKPQRLDY